MERFYIVFNAFCLCGIFQSSFGTVVDNEFTRKPLCSVQTFIDNNCMLNTPARGKVDCARICSEDNLCMGVSLDSAETCYTHLQCGVDNPSQCTDANDDDSYTFYVKSAPPVQVLDCLNGGSWDYQLNRCSCINVWCGKQCERRPINCYDLYFYGYSTMAWMFTDLILPNSTSGVPVLCHYVDGDDNFKTYIMNNYYRGSVTFNRTWDEYLTGFMSYPSQMWLGLDRLWNLNRNGYTEFRLFIISSQGHYEFKYKNFHIGNETDLFRYTIEKDSFVIHSGEDISIGDCFVQNQNTPFSTYDRLNVPGSNCPEIGHSGWWFKSGCNFFCLPMGQNKEQLALPKKVSHFMVDGVDISTLQKVSAYFQTDIASLDDIY